MSLPIMSGMEFQDVVRRRKMVRNYTDRPGRPGRRRPRAANATRAPSAGFSQGWAFLVLDTPDDVRRFWAATADDELDDPDEWLDRHDARAGRDRAVLEQVGLPRPLRRARQGLDRPRRGPLAGAVLAHGRRDGLAADPADRGRRGPRLLLLRHPADQAAASATEFAIPEAFDPVGAITIGHPAATSGRAGLAQPSTAQGPRRGRAPRHLGRLRRTIGGRACPQSTESPLPRQHRTVPHVSDPRHGRIAKRFKTSPFGH